MSAGPKEKTVVYEYRFSDGRHERFDLAFSPEMALDGWGREEPWTALSFHPCSHCPLPGGGHCPFAKALVPVIERFSGDLSYTPVVVTVHLGDKLIQAERALQHGLSPLIGLIGATTGCPHLEFFRPMARTHLPFADQQDTLFRVIASHLLGRYFTQGRGGTLSLDFPGLAQCCADAAQVNRFMAGRIRAVSTNDAVVNALITLDSGIQTMPYVIEDELEDLAWLYQGDEK